MANASLKEAVVSLPIKPKKAFTLGYLIIPFLTTFLAKQTGRRSILAYNTRGYEENADALSSTSFTRQLKKAGIVSDQIWIDSDAANKKEVENIFKKLLANGNISKKKTSVQRCPCRRVEMLTTEIHWAEKKKLYRKVGSEHVCISCKGTIETERNVEVYVFTIPTYPNTLEVFPAFSALETREIGKRFVKKELLISKTRPSALPISVGGNTISLDPDFVWQLYLLILRKNTLVPRYVISSQKNIFGTYLAATLYTLLYTEPITIIVPSYGIITKEEDVDQCMRIPACTELLLLSNITFAKKQFSFHTRDILSKTKKEITVIRASIAAFLQTIHSKEIAPLLEAFSAKTFSKHIKPEMFNDSKFNKIQKSLDSNELFIQGCKKAFGSNLVCIQQIGSGKRRDTNPFSDIDYIVVVKTTKTSQLRALREFVQTISFLIDCSVLALDEMHEGNRFRIGTHGSYQLALILPESVTLYGENIFKKIKKPSKEDIRQSVKEKLAEYTWWSRRIYVESNRERSLSLNYQINSRLIKMIRDVLYLENGLGMKEHKKQLITNFLAAFPTQYSAAEKQILFDLADSALTTQTTTNMSEEYLDGRLGIVNKIYERSQQL